MPYSPLRSFNRTAPVAAYADEEQGTILPHTDEDRGIELFYALSESMFAAVAAEMVDLGWSVFPQSSESRLPATVYGEMIKWGQYKDSRPDAATIRRWKEHCGTQNLATIFGPASSHAFALDIDVLDPAIVRHVVALADEILGYTPLRREGREPKIALIFRHAPEDVVRSTVRTLAVDGEDKAQIEIQGAGKTLTFHGKHHKTGRYFKWLDSSPMLVGPSAATLVTSAQVEKFFTAVEQVYGFVGAPTLAATGKFVGNSPVSGYNVPVMSEVGVARGRWHLTNQICFEAVKANVDRIHDAIGDAAEMEAVTAAIITAATASWQRTAVMGGRWTEGFVLKTISSNVRSTVLRVARGNLFPKPPPRRTPPKIRPAFRPMPPIARPR